MFTFHVDSDLDILFEKLTAQTERCILKAPSAHHILGVEDFMQCLSSLKILFRAYSLMMNSITKILNKVSILTKDKDRKQVFCQ